MAETGCRGRAAIEKKARAWGPSPHFVLCVSFFFAGLAALFCFVLGFLSACLVVVLLVRLPFGLVSSLRLFVSSALHLHLYLLTRPAVLH